GLFHVVSHCSTKRSAGVSPASGGRLARRGSLNVLGTGAAFLRYPHSMRKYDFGRLEIRKRNRLPHWDAEHAIYFITWCLVDAIPAPVLIRFRAERDAEYQRVLRLRGGVTIPASTTMDAALTDALQRLRDHHHGD